jgi:DNA (cytosine-5)-methyltransferase 1
VAVTYFNEIEPGALAVLLNCFDGYIDARSIVDVQPDDVCDYARCHWFAGAGLWEVACQMAGWPATRPIWTASCPCQPFSVAGKGRAADDPRHLWPDLFRLVRAVRPPTIVGEQVAGPLGYGWLDGVASDLETEGYAFRAVDLPALAVDAPHQRQRLYWVAVADADSGRHEGRPPDAGRQEIERATSQWADACWVEFADGRRRAKRGVDLLVDGVAGNLDVRRLAGNSIVAPLAAQVLKALLETT